MVKVMDKLDMNRRELFEAFRAGAQSVIRDAVMIYHAPTAFRVKYNPRYVDYLAEEYTKYPDVIGYGDG